MYNLAHVQKLNSTVVCILIVHPILTHVSRILCNRYVVLLAVVFPQDLLEKGLEANNFAMLGLGDIVIPGILIALLLRFDVR